jgi:Holliday junction resolvase
MSIHRYAARADSNRGAIAQVFRAHGWVVYDLRMPVDLLCGKGGTTLLVECKVKKGRHTDAQTTFLSTWTGGPVLTIRDEAAAQTVAAAY